jgi:hypothetical protein
MCKLSGFLVTLLAIVIQGCASTAPKSHLDKSQQFTSDDATHAALKLRGEAFLNDENTVRSYMNRYKPELYKISNNNEFKWPVALEETRIEMKRKAEAYDLNRTFVVAAEIEIKPYDFEKGGFPYSRQAIRYPFSGGAPIGALELLLVIPEGYIPMAQDKAAKFVQGYSNAKRIVYVDVEYMVKSFLPWSTVNRQPDALKADAKKISFYSDRNKQNLIGQWAASN